MARSWGNCDRKQRSVSRRNAELVGNIPVIPTEFALGMTMVSPENLLSSPGLQTFSPMLMLIHPQHACDTLWIAWAASWWIAAIWSSRTQSSAGVVQQLPYRLLAIAGFLLLFAIHSSSRLWTLPGTVAWAMVLLTGAGFAFAWWARLHLGKLWSAFVTRKADHHIIDTGPYAIVRHPIYTGIILAAVATATTRATAYSIAGAFLIVLGFWIKARLEERFLSQQLGIEAYDQYRARVPMLVPFTR